MTRSQSFTPARLAPQTLPIHASVPVVPPFASTAAPAPPVPQLGTSVSSDFLSGDDSRIVQGIPSHLAEANSPVKENSNVPMFGPTTTSSIASPSSQPTTPLKLPSNFTSQSQAQVRPDGEFRNHATTNSCMCAVCTEWSEIWNWLARYERQYREFCLAAHYLRQSHNAGASRNDGPGSPALHAGTQGNF